jgi:predicted amidohydrolase
MKFVNVASVQFQCEALRGGAGAHEAVLRNTREVLDSLRGYGLDLVVFCEGVEAVGQTMAQAESVDEPGPFLRAYAEFAAAERCHVAGSVKLREGGRVYNSIVYIGPDGGIIGAYYKTFLTRSELEEGVTPGRGAMVFDTAIGRLGGIICFDLNFPQLRAQYKALKPDVLTFASMYHGGLMQEMWAYDCRSFFVSALYFMGCGVLDPFGRPLRVTDCYTKIARAAINLDRAMVHLDYNREKFPDIEKKYLGEVVVDIPPNIGSALIYSLTDKRSAMDVVKEFELTLLDDYMARSVQENEAARHV